MPIEQPQGRMAQWQGQQGSVLGVASSALLAGLLAGQIGIG